MNTFVKILFLIVCSTFAVCAEKPIQTILVNVKQGYNVSDISALANSSAVFPNSIFDQKISDALLSASAQQTISRLRRYVQLEVSNQNVQAVLQQLQSDSRIESAQINSIVQLHEERITNDSLSGEQFALGILEAKKAWTIATGKGVLVGVIDTGIEWQHPDLVQALAISVAEDINNNATFEPWPSIEIRNGVSGDLNGIDEDENGFIDDVIGYDVVDQTFGNIGDSKNPDPVPFDEQGHGTSVSGVIAATPNNEIGISGLATGAKIITIRAFDATGNAEEDDIAMAIVYAAKRGAQVVNMSFGDGVDSPIMRDAVAYAAEMNCLLIASSGNTGGVSQQFPASYAQVMAVGATTSSDNRAVFSSTGSIVSLTAPGDRITTTAVGLRYRTVSGTSFAAPYVAATAAMLLQRSPGLSTRELKGILEESSTDLGIRGWDVEYGAGRLNAYAALLQKAPTIISIEGIQTLQEFSSTAITPLIGTAITPLFENYTLAIGSGVEPTTWNQLGIGNKQIPEFRNRKLDIKKYNKWNFRIAITSNS